MHVRYRKESSEFQGLEVTLSEIAVRAGISQLCRELYSLVIGRGHGPLPPKRRSNDQGRARTSRTEVVRISLRRETRSERKISSDSAKQCLMRQHGSSFSHVNIIFNHDVFPGIVRTNAEVCQTLEAVRIHTMSKPFSCKCFLLNLLRFFTCLRS